MDPRLPVLVPGDKERAAWCATEEQGSVTFVRDLIESSEELAKKLKVKPMVLEGQSDFNPKNPIKPKKEAN